MAGFDEIMADWLSFAMPPILFLLMAGVGLGVSFDELRKSAARWKLILMVVVSMQLVLPAVVLLAVSQIQLSAPIAAGMVMLASCPGGLFSNYLTTIARANVALSITLTTYITIIYAFTAPLWAWFAVKTLISRDAGIPVNYDPSSIFVSLLLTILLPVIAGSALRTWQPRLADRFGALLRDIGASLLVLAYVALVYANFNDIRQSVSEAFLPVLIFLAVTMTASFGLVRVLNLSREDSVAISIEHVLRQEGTGIMIAASLLAVPLAALPMLLSSVLGVLFAAIIAFAARAQSPRSADHQ